MKFLVILFLLLSQISFGSYYPIRHNSFVIRVTEEDKVLLKNKEFTLLNLGNQLYNYYSFNTIVNKVKTCVNYENISQLECTEQIAEINTVGCYGYGGSYYENKKKHWQSKLYILKALNVNEYRFPSNETYIQIGVKRNTSYNMYIQVLSKVKETIVKLRNEKAQKLFNTSYDSILEKQDQSKMKKYKYIIDVLVPEWIFDLPVTS